MATLEPPKEILSILRASLLQEGKGSVDLNDEMSGSEEIIGYAAFLAAGLAEMHQFDPSVWEEALSPHLSALLDDTTVVEKFRSATEKALVVEDAEEEYGADDDEEVEELCDLRFK